jgi:hypothetical protein
MAFRIKSPASFIIVVDPVHFRPRGPSRPMMTNKGINGNNQKGRSIRRPQTVTNPGFRQNVLRAFGIIFNFLPKLPHIDAQILRINQFIP